MMLPYVTLDCSILYHTIIYYIISVMFMLGGTTCLTLLV